MRRLAILEVDQYCWSLFLPGCCSRRPSVLLDIRSEAAAFPMSKPGHTVLHFCRLVRWIALCPHGFVLDMDFMSL